MWASLFAVGCVSPAPTPSPPADPGWFGAAPLLAPLQEHSVVALQGEVVVLGGYDDRLRMVDRVEAYDPGTDRWRSLAPLPEPAHHLNAAVVDDQIVVVGALQDSFLEIAVTWVYDPALDAWEQRRPPSFDRAVGASVVGVIDGVIHLVGGLSASRAVALHSSYDPAADRWTALPSAPLARDHAAGGVIDGALVVTAGRDGGLSAVIDALDRYDAATEAWSVGAPIPTPRGGVAAAVSAEGALHVLGGEGNPEDPDGIFAAHEVYDPALDAWRPLGAMRTARHGMGAVFLDGTLWVPGGAPVAGFGATDVNEGWR